uniref:Eukaryotic translation elongation factor 1 epsilon-1 n=1 Tax=Schistocephalus solidus TaxID=70667 RepID=A0A0X3PNH1_SCHSO
MDCLSALRTLSKDSPSLQASTDLEKALVFQYLEWNQRFLQSKSDKSEQKKLLRILSTDLQNRTYLTGFVFKAIDFLIADSIKESLIPLTFEEKEGICEVLRWYTHVQRQVPSLPYISFQRCKIY